MSPFQSSHDVGSQLWCDDLSRYIGQTVDDDSVAELQENRPGRWHLGASEIGHKCSRKIWYSFRWATLVRHSGRMNRLFRRGHSEEPKFVNRLTRIGLQIWDYDPHATAAKLGLNESSPLDDDKVQWRIEHPETKHFGGSLDGIAFVPWLPSQFAYMICEFKTHNDNSFKKLRSQGGVRRSKPQHYGQMCTYGKQKGYKFGLYCAINKNDDDLYFEIVPLDWDQAGMLERKAVTIVNATIAPQKLSQTPTHVECKMCDHAQTCHFGKPPEKSCRSCVYATAEPSGEWYCHSHRVWLERNVVLVGCQNAYTAIQ